MPMPTFALIAAAMGTTHAEHVFNAKPWSTKMSDQTSGNESQQASETEREKARDERRKTEVDGASERSGSGNTLGDGSSNKQKEG